MRGCAEGVDIGQVQQLRDLTVSFSSRDQQSYCDDGTIRTNLQLKLALTQRKAIHGFVLNSCEKRYLPCLYSLISRFHVNKLVVFERSNLVVVSARTDQIAVSRIIDDTAFYGQDNKNPILGLDCAKEPTVGSARRRPREIHATVLLQLQTALINKRFESIDGIQSNIVSKFTVFTEQELKDVLETAKQIRNIAEKLQPHLMVTHEVILHSPKIGRSGMKRSPVLLNLCGLAVAVPSLECPCDAQLHFGDISIEDDQFPMDDGLPQSKRRRLGGKDNEFSCDPDSLSICLAACGSTGVLSTLHCSPSSESVDSDATEVSF